MCRFFYAIVGELFAGISIVRGLRRFWFIFVDYVGFLATKTSCFGTSANGSYLRKNLYRSALSNFFEEYVLVQKVA
jgi:hypothetical protein